MMIYANTVSKHHTHFIAALQLIQEARKKWQSASENWPDPTSYKLGTPQKDGYYAEVWVDGMDWQNTYWCLESIRSSDPICMPLLRFTSHEEQDILNSWDFENIINALLHYRRNDLWIKHSDILGIYQDSVWPFLNPTGEQRNKFWVPCHFEHNSQPQVEIWINETFLPIDDKKTKIPRR